MNQSTAIQWSLCVLFAVGLGVNVFAQVSLESKLPILYFRLAHNGIPDEPKRTADLTLFAGGVDGINRFGQAERDYEGKAAIERRGSTSQLLFPKVGYGFELRTVDGEDRDASLLGLPEEEDWVLHGPYSDKSLIRNALAYSIAGDLMAYAPRIRFVELVLGNEYRGIYLLTERIKRDQHRIDISKLREEDNAGLQLTGGYILKLDKTTGSNSEEFVLPALPIQPDEPTKVLYHYPPADEITAPQRAYIQGIMVDFEERLGGPAFDDPVQGYLPLIDLASFVDYFLVNEVAKNTDGYRLSTFLYKDRDDKDGRLKMGPVWDFNLAFGNINYCEGWLTEGWSANFNSVCPDDFYYSPFWWPRLLSSRTFQQAVIDRYTSLRRDGPLSDAALQERISELLDQIGPEATTRNFERWPVIGSFVWPNVEIFNTQAREVLYVRDWVSERLAWMDQAILEFPVHTNVAVNAFSTVRVVPNPARGSAVFEGLAPSQYPCEAQLVDARGRLVAQYRLSSAGESLQLPSTAGLYHVLLTLASGQRAQARIVVE